MTLTIPAYYLDTDSISTIERFRKKSNLVRQQGATMLWLSWLPLGSFSDFDPYDLTWGEATQ